ncbi:phosphatidylinositol 4,5-bisphosphate 5-phosphatase A [Penaeus vannamei]|nr:phosphatidylinositol 4,5-bisphosphate 5-phosphatase A-like [Penaeus vannamei]XP_027219247.1 phosphatidylinositol 4,5-bisphosphate 5-phosphatase A-like [Penaeus vannamei]
MDTISMCCVTWNVETGWPEQDLHNLLGIRKDPVIKRESDDLLPDIYVVSLQEVKSQPQNVVMDALFEEPWTLAFREVVGPHDYVKISTERLQGLVTTVYVKRKHVHHIRDIHTSVTRTGFGGLWGNKGAASIRFTLYGCSVCVVNCHLAAHDNGYKERVENFNAIIDYSTFPVPETSNILFHDYVFWMGDLNFRFESHLTGEEIVQLIKASDWGSLMEVDELIKAQKSGDAFSMLKEERLSFPPTYKYKEGTSTYDLARRPAWTDRILHQVHVDAYENVKLGVEQSSYTHSGSYTQSDHKPVKANFRIKVFANHEERCVRFTCIGTWLVGEGGPVKFTIDADVTTSTWDYVALYKADFTCMQQYITYMYVPQPSPGSGQRTFQMVFNDELLQHPGMYRLLYYSGKYSSYLGMSDPFPVLTRQD